MKKEKIIIVKKDLKPKSNGKKVLICSQAVTDD